MCQTWSGGPGFAVEVGGDLTVSGEGFITTYASSQWAERAFCKKCGTHLFYRLKAGGYMNFPLGLLENTDHLKFSTQIFIDKKPAHYNFAEKTAIMTEAEFLDSMK
jgi:hypothetical protein